MSVYKVIYERETELRSSRFEAAFAVDETSKVVLEKVGEEAEIAFTEEEIRRLRDASGVIFTHNHPGGWKYTPEDPRHGGNSFSPHDIHLVCRAELAEIRVVTPRFRFSMRPSEDGWNEQYWHSTLWPIYHMTDAQVKNELADQALYGVITPLEASARRFHTVWKRVANLLGLRYTMVEE
ncbi:MAG TPA: hypothetical protein VKU00_27590 [Chthonomonadaceae bacterium]|nr:hypothetical protein [Chthonomonadaceae bacterium]